MISYLQCVFHMRSQRCLPMEPWSASFRHSTCKRKHLPTMNKKTLLCAGLFAGLPAVALAYGRFGFGFNFGFPLYDYPAPTRVIVVQQPAATEVAPPSPGMDYVWVAGHWEWETAGNRWLWYGGSWQRPPAPNAVWQAGYWSQRGHRWIWVPAHWAIPNPPPAVPSMPSGDENPPPAPQAAPTPPADPAMVQESVVVNEAPPPPIVEEVYAAPGPDYVWIGGLWTWSGAWVWAPGHYARAPHRGAVWIGGSWNRGAHGWSWAGGRWR